MTALLEAENLVKSFGRFRAVDGVSLDLFAGEMLAIIGPNGAGKSTCFNLINGQLTPDSGEVRLEGERVTGLSAQRMARRGIGRTFQIAETFGSMTVMENVATSLIALDRQTGHLWPGLRADHRAEAEQVLARVGMADQSDRSCALLAYGDLKRVDLALALAQRPRVLLMDEPTAGMAPGERSQLMELTAKIALSDGIAVLFTEHDMDVVFGHAGRVLVLDHGQVIASGTPAEVRANRMVQEVYLGQDSHNAGSGHGPA